MVATLSTMEVVVLSDTHVRSGGATRLSEAAAALVAAADVVLHCGDVVAPSFLHELRESGPVYAVLGNNDVELVGALPEELTVDLGGVRIAMVHDAGRAKGRAARLARRYPDSDVVVFGHSHIPVNEPGVDGQWLMNPGSATQRRRQPHHTLGVLTLENGRVARHEIVVVDRE
jgi:uncharacterized protein